MINTNATTSMMKFSFILGFVVLLFINHFQCYKADEETEPAPTCQKYECPPYISIHKDEEFEIRLYNHTIWMSTSEIASTSFKDATKEGFLKLLDYVKGDNKEEQKVPMTAPAVTDVILFSGSPSCYNSSFAIRLPIPTQFQDSPPAAMDDMELHPQVFNSHCTAVRTFGGFTTDQNVKDEAKKLKATLVGTPWGTLLRSNFSNECLSKDDPPVFTVAQYNSPFENVSRVNEIWFTLEDSKGTMCSI
ncbi:hypothetical protein SUGI_0099150 [Cryptomeria japonica]|uniref:uncharacterized protein LOC131050952 n=1 Tax=Cryptomeria japonica TaxID=3369 RepID=UPI002408B4EB|nr:uncharacterized protein LOC131050952 [Cryptomeria japonica]GLJ08949.1 hypothetical protein SUGI_0099150 [Cryptomeria japonica]